MDEIFFKELKLPSPKYNLNVGSQNRTKMISLIKKLSQNILITEKPDWVLVQGDTNTVLAGAQIAHKLGIKVAHIEAGLRSYDKSMPEEINRIKTDHISDILFPPTEAQKNILIKEGIDQSKIFVVGNTIVDSVNQNLKLIKKVTKKFFLLTLHRPSNVDNSKTLTKLINNLSTISKKFNIPFVFPIHPRTALQIKLNNIKLDEKYFEIKEPVGYLEMLALEKYAQIVFTDSGGLQEETCILHTPCITLRENTERPETIDVGANILASNNINKLITQTDQMLNIKKTWSNPFGNGKTSIQILNHFFK
jgi:UDP-N-acetylglucosamine 2-epimerase (non-hydrolysing)